MKRSTQRWRWALRLLASAAITIALLYAIQQRYDTIPDDLSVPAWVIPSYLLMLLAYFVTRVGRWLVLLKPLGHVPLAAGMKVGLAGTMWIAWLPWRLGELARPLFLAQHSSIPFSRALGSIAVERVVDGLFVCGLFFASFALVTPRPGFEWLYTGCVAIVSVFLLALTVLVAMARWPRAIGGLVDRTAGRVVPTLARALATMANGVSEGLAALPSLRPLVLFLLGTTAYWGMNILGMWVLARGCGLELSLAETTTVMATINLSLLIPGPPAQLGTFQAGVFTGLSLFVEPATLSGPGAVYAFYLYACQIVMISALGIASQFRLEIRWRDLMRSLTGAPEDTTSTPAAPPAQSPP
jgi:uncharacterized membrane protein YbhN (UPF0104 family)